MEKLSFKNSLNQDVYYLAWKVNNPKCSVVISHGMAEHPQRYNQLANHLNSLNINVYAIFHIGHGDVASKLAHMDINDFDRCIENVNELILLAKNENNHNVFLIGHSMGSFVSQLYITRFNNIDGLVLSGSTKTNLLLKVSSVLTSIIKVFSKDLTKPSNFLNNLAFGSYNSKYENVKTKFDWLTTDEKIVNEYINDPYCGWVGTRGFFYNLTHATAIMSNKKALSKINKDLPILIIGGKDDPVSSYGKGLKLLYKQYKDLSIENVEMIIYDKARHEVYNEYCKEKAYNDTSDFILKNIK